MGAGLIQATERWRGPSTYIPAVLTGRADAARGRRGLLAATLLLASGAGLLIGGAFAGVTMALSPLIVSAWLGSYVLLSRWCARRKSHSRLAAFLERVRSSLAYEGDPGAVQD